MPIPDWLKSAGTWPRDWAEGELRFIPRKSKPPLLARVTGKGDREKIEPMYVLVKSVDVPAKHYLRMDAQAGSFFHRLMGRYLHGGS